MARKEMTPEEATLRQRQIKGRLAHKANQTIRYVAPKVSQSKYHPDGSLKETKPPSGEEA